MYGWFAGSDYRLYMETTRNWLEGGSFYPHAQTTGPYVLEWGAILYPPQLLVLFIPFSALPPLLWWLIPSLILLGTVAAYRPSAWTAGAILACLALWPLGAMTWWSGTPTIWFVALMALATRWPTLSALLLAKPTLLPFALLGARSRAWWIVAGVVIASAGLMPGLTWEWGRSLFHARGPMASLLYSLENVPLMVIPLIAWAGRRAPAPSAERQAPHPLPAGHGRSPGAGLPLPIPGAREHRVPDGS